MGSKHSYVLNCQLLAETLIHTTSTFHQQLLLSRVVQWCIIQRITADHKPVHHNDCCPCNIQKHCTFNLHELYFTHVLHAINRQHSEKTQWGTHI